MTNCPHCQSDHTSSYRMLWMSGTASGSVSGTGITANGQIGLIGGTSSQQTFLAQSVAPPTPPPLRGFLFGCLLPFIVCLVLTTMLSALMTMVRLGSPVLAKGLAPLLSNVSFFWLAILCIAGSLVLRNVYLQMKKQKLAPVLQTWERSWLCLKCGVSWVV